METILVYQHNVFLLLQMRCRLVTSWGLFLQVVSGLPTHGSLPFFHPEVSGMYTQDNCTQTPMHLPILHNQTQNQTQNIGQNRTDNIQANKCNNSAEVNPFLCPPVFQQSEAKHFYDIKWPEFVFNQRYIELNKSNKCILVTAK